MAYSTGFGDLGDLGDFGGLGEVPGKYAGLSDYDFIAALYQDLLGRSGSQDEIMSWVNGYTTKNGFSREDAYQSFLLNPAVFSRNQQITQPAAPQPLPLPVLTVPSLSSLPTWVWFAGAMAFLFFRSHE